MERKVYTTSVKQYLQQLRAAAAAEKDMHDNLIAAGFKWDADLRQYTHPDKPGVIVEL